ncbi:MAG: single-stranded-DNA-specific exonuclease RecJ [Chitinophagaceae bacterium]|nr:MAG: single-stranded-DNA-specific exonuclease RecJ [Chitinophagaceae bacterium]
MQLPEKKWILTPADKEKVASLKNELKVSEEICTLLVQRDIYTFDSAKDFFRPELSHLHNPFLMKDMDKAVDRILEAISQNQKVLVYGDYDVDGTTAVTLMYDFLSHAIQNLDFYIPNRYKEGYGISTAGIEFASREGFHLVIALDCGIKAVEKIKYAKELGVDFIICDHHLPGEELPPAHAVLDPKQSDCNYPYKELSGCGVGFKLIQALKAKTNNPAFPDPCDYLDLLAISIGCDIVPITGENRVLAYYGLQKINESPRKGVEAILKTGSIKKEITIMDLVFVIGPRINAAGRIADAKNAVYTLLSKNVETANDEAKILNKRNTNRKELDKQITESATQLILNDPEYPAKKTTLVFHPEWHKGVIGIVASRLVERFYRPTIVFTESNDMITASARSIEGFNIHDAIKKASGNLEQFGGHFYAAGLSLKKENLQAFMEEFERIVAETITEEQLIPRVKIDAELDFQRINPKFLQTINQFAPFGPGNMRPIFVSKALHKYGNYRIVGDHHLKITFKAEKTAAIPAIGFNLAEKAGYLGETEMYDICYCLSENEWQGVKSLQLELKDLKKSSLAVWN